MPTSNDDAARSFQKHTDIQKNMRSSQWRHSKAKLFHTLGYGGSHPGEESFSPNARAGEVAECFRRAQKIKRRPQSAKVFAAALL